MQPAIVENGRQVFHEFKRNMHYILSTPAQEFDKSFFHLNLIL